MIKLRIWDKESSIVYNNGVEASAGKVMQDYPQTKYGTTIIEHLDGNENIVGFWTIGDLKKVYNLPDGLTDEETISAAENAINNPPKPYMDMSTVTKSDLQLLGQLLTEMNLNILEGK